MKRIWARVGMSLDISDEEYEELKKLRDENGDLTILECDSDLNLRFLERGYADGETYIPSVVFDEIDGIDSEELDSRKNAVL